MLTKKTFFTRFLIFAIAMGFAFSSYGETITAVSDGDWNDEDTWDLREPESGDTIIIPANITVDIPVVIEIDLTGSETTLLRIWGTLYFESFNNYALNSVNFDIGDGDKVEIYEGGEVSSNTDINSLYSGFVFESGDEQCFPFVGCFPINSENFPIYNETIEGPTAIEDGKNIPLPVVLISFEAQPSFNSVKISWSTATEKNNDYFTLERSKDGINFETMETVYGAGTTNEVQHYEVVDESPLYGWSYYRLSQTDYDGTTEVFDPVTVEFAPEISKPELAVYPNPVVHDNFTAKISGDFNADYAQIELYDLNGNRVLSERHPLQSGKFLNAEVYLRSGLQAGYYIVRVHVAGQTFASRIMKN